MKGARVMKIKDILQNIDIVSHSVPQNMLSRQIVSLCHNSRYADPTCLFFCKRGALTDGHKYAPHAYENGARFFVAERELDLPDDAAVIIVKDSNEALRKLSVVFYDDPASELRVIGITGTKGKTTVALSVYNIASASGRRVGYIGTNGIYYNGKVFETANTTPDCLDLQKALRDMRDEGVEVVVIEVSSQALWQQRVYGIKFDTCVFTNLYQDHVGGVEHPTLEHYRDCKKLLFTDYEAKNIVVNADCEATAYMLDGVSCDNILTVSAEGREDCDIFARSAKKEMNGIRPGVSFELFSGVGSSLPLCEHGESVFMSAPGLYSVENGLLTFAVCRILGISTEFIISELAKLSIPGRFEVVELESRPDTLFVIDYAHNGASLSAVLGALREYEPRRIICLFGSVGGRTFGRRAELGAAAKKGADVIIVTSDNPDNEDPMDVINDINASLEGTDKPVYLIPDRKEAIEKAFEISEDGDFVLLAGKGHESYQLVMGKRVPFSEKEILRRVDMLELTY